MRKKKISLSAYDNKAVIIYRLKGFFCCLILLISSEVFAQKLTYNVVKGRKTIGKMTVEKLTVGDTVKYQIESKVEFNLILSFKVDFSSEEVYVNDVLVDGYAESRLNGKPQKKSIVKGDGEKYVVNLNGSLLTLSRDQIKNSIPLLYFEKPINESTVFSQQFSDFLPIKTQEDGSIELNSPDGKNVYRYEGNRCREVRVFRTYANFSFKLVD